MSERATATLDGPEVDTQPIAMSPDEFGQACQALWQQTYNELRKTGHEYSDRFNSRFLPKGQEELETTEAKMQTVHKQSIDLAGTELACRTLLYRLSGAEGVPQDEKLPKISAELSAELADTSAKLASMREVSSLGGTNEVAIQTEQTRLTSLTNQKNIYDEIIRDHQASQGAAEVGASSF